TSSFNPEWWEVVEGTYPVPAAFNITKDMMGQLQALKQIAGPYSYATLQDDPPSVKHLAGTTELPVIKVPGSLFQVFVGQGLAMANLLPSSSTDPFTLVFCALWDALENAQGVDTFATT